MRRRRNERAGQTKRLQRGGDEATAGTERAYRLNGEGEVRYFEPPLCGVEIPYDVPQNTDHCKRYATRTRRANPALSNDPHPPCNIVGLSEKEVTRGSIQVPGYSGYAKRLNDVMEVLTR